jgi:serine/threonine-protein kinase
MRTPVNRASFEAARDLTGRQVGHYQILSRLGEGGMGVVYKARDTHLDRFVAIKVLPAELVADSDRKRRFVQEAKAASALNHPNIITIHDISSDNGTDFMVMEYVEGKTLGQLIPRRGLKLNEVLKYAIQVSDALTKAQAAGIIHRDLKPGNIMVGEDGLVKVLDFGLAKLDLPISSAPMGSTVTAPPMQTEVGMILGRRRTWHLSRPGGCLQTRAGTCGPSGASSTRCSPVAASLTASTRATQSRSF